MSDRARASHLVVIPEYLAAPYVDVLRRDVDVIYDPDLHADRVALLEAINGASALVIRNRTQMDRALLEAAPNLIAVGRLGVGLDNVDLLEIERAQVDVFVADGANTEAVAEYVIGATFRLLRDVFAMTDDLLAGSWPRQGTAFGLEMSGRTLGLIGFGAIARAVARRAGSLGMEVLAHDPYVADDDAAWAPVVRCDLDSVLERADVVSLHVPLLPSTRHMLGAEEFRRMKSSAILINTSRGAVVDDHALAAALRNGELAGAALDVFASEPLDAELRRLYAGIDTLILTPHIAGNTEESADRVARATIDALLARLARC